MIEIGIARGTGESAHCRKAHMNVQRGTEKHINFTIKSMYTSFCNAQLFSLNHSLKQINMRNGEFDHLLWAENSRKKSAFLDKVCGERRMSAASAELRYSHPNAWSSFSGNEWALSTERWVLLQGKFPFLAKKKTAQPLWAARVIFIAQITEPSWKPSQAEVWQH